VNAGPSEVAGRRNHRGVLHSLGPDSALAVIAAVTEAGKVFCVSTRMTVSIAPPAAARHTRWVRSTHWIGALAFLTLAFTGIFILMAHPRLYWGEVGNDLTPALLELPISRNHQHGGWDRRTPFRGDAAAVVSAVRTYDIFNQNGWGRSLHFLAGWIMVGGGAVYLLTGMITGHFRRHLIPRAAELTPRLLAEEFRDHLRLHIAPPTGGPQYGRLQKCAYVGVIFAILPLMVVTGLAMSPAVSATYPFLSDMFGGFQSARTVHFFGFVALILFLVGHVLMVVLSGFTRQMRSMTVGE
jgi:thiosulfate reductase cytochrome b subunit